MVTTQEQIVREAPEVEARKLGLLDTAKNLASTPVGGFRYDDLGNPILENVIDPVTGLPVKDEQGNIIQRPVRAGLPGQQIAGLSPQQQSQRRQPTRSIHQNLPVSRWQAGTAKLVGHQNQRRF